VKESPTSDACDYADGEALII